MAVCIISHRHNEALRQGHRIGRIMLGVLTFVHAVLSSAVAQSDVDPPQSPDGQIIGNGAVESAFVRRVTAPFESVLLDLRSDGESIRKGEVVAELDTSELQDQMHIQEIQVAICQTIGGASAEHIEPTEENSVHCRKYTRR